MGYICFPHDFPVARHCAVSAAFELNLPVSLGFAGRFFQDIRECKLSSIQASLKEAVTESRGRNSALFYIPILSFGLKDNLLD